MTIQSTVEVAIVESENVIVVRQLVRHQRMDCDMVAADASTASRVEAQKKREIEIPHLGMLSHK